MTLLAPPGTPTKPAAAKKPRGASTMLRFSRYIYASVTACLIFLATRRFNPLCVDPAKFPRKGITTWVSPRDRHLPPSGRSAVWLHAKTGALCVVTQRGELRGPASGLRRQGCRHPQSSAPHLHRRQVSHMAEAERAGLRAACRACQLAGGGYTQEAGRGGSRA